MTKDGRHDALVERLLAGDRTALARAITLVESTRADHRIHAEAVIEQVLPAAGKSIRLGISGAPGVGKSTFIEAFGMRLIGKGHKVAVLAVDPSSRLTHGSILGDKTRMEELSRAKDAFIRPSPAGGTLGGVARRTREAITLCEAAGFDFILVETVGVGQSETAVADMVDLFCLLLQPAAGDELQGIKKGIVELAELILVTKGDGELLPVAERTAADYRAALRLLRHLSAAWTPEVIVVSGLTGKGLDGAYDAIRRHHELLEANGEFAARRAAQAEAALRADFGTALLDLVKRRPDVAETIPQVEQQVRAGKITPAAGVRRLLDIILGPRDR
ncbi:MAG: methylmalonyl Co-A mutase-associated GTPase MeaB [Alphaproteobacteria bacterium]|nr:methylmalonyl Co-A mutase-associated GTPase MeaB [Alphaproteobacteria bacterium]MBL6937243.1 methylmalonyl Co-A mutase-associated GTPase MeaB [Alphaproteobacteria bacterium]MBL7096195.1 methylmalonyl Co-A mutase-associated GTPase MeaB [Alphaproteobacteria bacterium]